MCVHILFSLKLCIRLGLGGEPVVNPTWLQESCGGKIIIGGVTGAVLGVGLGEKCLYSLNFE